MREQETILMIFRLSTVLDCMYNVKQPEGIKCTKQIDKHVQSALSV